MKDLRGYQGTGFERFKDMLFFCINFACGLGKTLLATVIALHKNKPTIIIAPNNLCDQWVDELVEAGVPREDIFIADVPRENKDPIKYYEDFENWLRGE